MVQPLRLVMAMGMEKKNEWKTGFAFNSASGFVQFVLTAVLIFLCIPIFINKLGEVSFGVFSTVAVVGNLTLFANLSLDSALVKFLAEQGKCRESNYDIVVSFSIISSILLPLTFLAYVFREFIIIRILNIPDLYLSDTSVLMGCFLVSNALLLLGRIITSILDSQHKVYLTNIAMFIYNAIYWGGIIAVISLGYGLKEIGIAVTLASIIWFVLITIMAFKEWGSLDITGFRENSRRIVKKQLTYTSKIYVGSLLGMLSEPLTKILIANLAGGVVMVGAYEIGLRVRSQILALFNKAIYPLYPIIAHMQNKVKVANIVNKVTYGLYFLVLPVIILISFGAEPFLKLWIGNEATNRSTILAVILLTNTALLSILVATPIYYYIRAKNHAGKEIYIQGLNVIVNLLIIFLFHRSLGFYSVLLGNTLALSASFSLCVYYQYKYLNFKLFPSVKGVGKFILYAISMLVIALLVNSLFANKEGWYLLVLSISVLATCAFMSYSLRILTKENINSIRSLS